MLALKDKDVSVLGLISQSTLQSPPSLIEAVLRGLRERQLVQSTGNFWQITHLGREALATHKQARSH